jgi:hypothetical protein
MAAVLAATMLTAVFATAMTLSMNYAEGQTLPSCPVGYERNELGICVPIVNPDGCPVGYHRSPSGLCVPDVIQPSDDDEDIVCSGFSYTCG